MTRKVLLFSRKEAADMSSVAEAQTLLQRGIGPVLPGTPLKALFPKVARQLGVTVRRVETIWQGTARRIDAAEMDRLRALASPKSNDTPEVAHASRYDAIAAALEAVDPDFHGQDIARYRGLARALRLQADGRQVAR